MGKHFINTLIIILLSPFFLMGNLQAQECLPPDNPFVYGVTGTSAIIAWGDYNENTNWKVALSTEELEDPSTAPILQTVTSTQEYITCPIQNLSANQLYHYYVCSVCGEENSEWVSGTFSTRCADKEVPYDNFNANISTETAIPECWTIIQGNASMYNLDQAHNNVLKLAGGCTVAMPSFNSPIDTLRVQFSLMASNANDLFEIGVIEIFEDWSTYTPIEVIHVSSAYSFEEKTVHLSSYTGQGRYIVMNNPSNRDFYIDDVTVSVIPNCLSPDNVQASNILWNSATLTWEETGTATQWNVLLSQTPITDFSAQTPIPCSSASYNASTLTPDHTYYFYVQSVCEGGGSEWARTTFSTICTPSTIPTSESFSPGEAPSCWSKECVTGSTNVSFVSNGSNPACYPAMGNAMVFWPSASTNAGSQARLVSLPLNTTGISTLDVNFKWDHSLTQSTATGDGVQLQYSTDGITWTDATHGMIHRYDGIHNGWTDYHIVMPEATDLPLVYIGFLFTTGGGGANCYLDEVSFRDTTGCFTPANLTANDIAGNSAVIKWDEMGTATAWNFILSETPVTDFTAISPITVSNTTYPANNLNPATTYYVYVRAKCSSNSFSEWTAATTFQTGCGDIISFPHTDSFENYGTCSEAFPTCWMRFGEFGSLGTFLHNGQVCQTPSATDLNAHDGEKSLMICSPASCHTYAITPPIREELRNLAVTFFLLKSADTLNGTFEIGVMSNPNDPATFESLATVEPATTGTWEFFSIPLNRTNLSGSGNRIVFRHFGMIDENYYLLDDLTIMEAPDCWPALFLSADDITGNSATLNWMNLNEGATLWVVKVSDSPISDMSQTANVFDQTIGNTSLTLDYLSGNTTYYYYVQSKCSSNSNGTWSQGSFTTLPCNCYVDIYMRDQWANGWEGAKIQLRYGTSVFAEASMTHNGTRDTARIYTCDTRTIDYWFVSGNYDQDISFQIVNSLGTTLYTSSGTPTAGRFLSAAPVCGVSCGTAPANLTVIDTNGRHLLTWEAAPNALSYSVYRSNQLIADYLTQTFYEDFTADINDTCYTVTAQCIVGESGPSNEACLHTTHDTIIDGHITDGTGIPAVSIFPNPAHDRFTVSADFPIHRISVVNLLGQEVFRSEVAGNRTEINVSELPGGIYLVKILDGRNWIVRKIIVE